VARFVALRPHRAEFQGTAAFASVALLVGVAFGLSTLITPLYPIYQRELGFSQVTLTLLYANVGALLFFGHISDHVGRRSIALSAIGVLAVATLVFLIGNGIAALTNPAASPTA